MSPAAPQIVCNHCGGDHGPAARVCTVTGRSMSDLGMVGQVVSGKYSIVKLLGAGGMGEVYDCEHVGTGRRVCLKRLRPEFRIDNVAMQRFEREARVAAAVDHEHVIEIIDVGVAEDGSPYFVMPRLSGESFAALLEREAPLPVQRACAIAVQVLRALGAAHDKGVTHRDLKPDNVFLQQKPSSPDHVTLLDFGISKAGGDGKLTTTGALLGTPAYMSPEQARGENDLDARTDLWSFGVMFYESLTGYPGYDARSFPEMLMKIISEPPPSLRERRPELPEILLDTCDALLQPDRDQRFASAREVLDVLEPFVQGRNQSSAAFASTMETPASVKALAIAEARGVGRTGARGVREPSGIQLSSNLETPPSRSMRVSTSPSMHGEVQPTTLSRNGGSNRTLAIIAGVVLAGGGASLGYVAWSHSHQSSALQTQPAPAPLPSPAPAPVLPAAAVPQPVAPAVVSDKIKLVVTVKPGDAHIVIDGGQVGDGWFEHEFPRDGAAHHVGATAPGFNDYVQLVFFDKPTQRVDLVLEKKHGGHSTPSSPTSSHAFPPIPPGATADPIPAAPPHVEEHHPEPPRHHEAPPAALPPAAAPPNTMKKGKILETYPGM